MGSATLLDSVWRLLANDPTFLSYRGWFKKTTLSANTAVGATSIQINGSVNYVSGEQLRIADGSGGWVQTNVTQSGSGTTIPVAALTAAVSSNADVQSNLTPSSHVADKIAYIQKEEETDGIVDSTSIPIVLIYIRPGKADHRSSQVYIGKVVIDCFAHDGNSARKMVEQTMKLMQNWQPDAIASFVSRFCYDSSFKTGITGTKGHRVFYDISYYVG